MVVSIPGAVGEGARVDAGNAVVTSPPSPREVGFGSAVVMLLRITVVMVGEAFDGLIVVVMAA